MIDFKLLASDLGVLEEKPQPNSPATAGTEPNGEPEPSFFREDDGCISVPELPPIVDSSAFVAEEIKPSPELVKGLIHQGTKVVIGGGSKSFKTWCQLDLSICVAYGLSWMGHSCTAGRVLFVNLEIKPEFFQARIKKICEARGIQQIPDRLDIWNLRGYSAPYRIILPRIIERIKDTGYSLIDLDPIYKLYGNTDENSASEVGSMMNELENVCVKTGATIAFGAHYSKGNQAAKESIDRISGSGVFSRDPDSIIPLTKHEEEDCFVVEPILRNLPPVQPFVVRWKYPLMQVDEDLDASKLKQAGGTGKKKEHDPIDILCVIRDNIISNPISISEWAEKSGLKRQTLQGYVELLRNEGFIATIGDGSGARKYITEKGLKKLL